MRLLALLAAVALTAEAPAPPQMQQFDDALTASHFNEAAMVLDKLIEQRTPADGKPRPDPLLNALLGRLYLAVREPGPAASYLDYASIAALPATMRARTALDHGRALELRGDRAAALAAYREALGASGTEDERRTATLGIARQLLPDAPANSRNMVMSVASGAPSPQRWQANYLLAVAASLLGDKRQAELFANQAWNDAVTAPVHDLAPLHVAGLRAGLAVAAHDGATERAMLTAANGLSLSASPALAAQLPICGDRGVRPSDYVIFGYVAGPYVIRQLVPISASRPEVVTSFADALAGFTPIKEADGTRPLATAFTVSCRSMVSPSFMQKPLTEDPLLDWLVQAGIYPASAWNSAEDKHLNAIADRIDSLAARFGKDSPLLIAPRWQTLTLLEKRAAAGDAVLPGQILDLASQIAAGLTRARAPQWIAETVANRPRYEQAVAAAADDPAQWSTVQELFRAQMRKTPFSFARAQLVAFLSNVHEEWPPALARLVLDVNAQPHSALGTREQQSWLLTVAEAQQALGDNAQARATLAAAGFARNLCTVADSEPKLLEQHFSYNDYPESLIAGEQEGSVLFDFDLSTAGTIAARRIVYSLPSGLFDEPSAKGLGAVRYTAPTRSGKPAACRGVYQPIVWRLEENSDFRLPALSPTMTGPVS